MKESHDMDVHALCTAFVNQGNNDYHCEVTSVFFNGHDINIVYKFPCTMGWKCSEWPTNMLELMAWAWNNPKG